MVSLRCTLRTRIEVKDLIREKMARSAEKLNTEASQLLRQVAVVPTSLREIASSQAEMEKLRVEEKDAVATNKDNCEDGSQGVRPALRRTN